MAITLGSSGAYVGDLLLFFNSFENQCAEIGYMLLPEFEGNGYMTEAVAALIGTAFSTFDIHRIVAHMDARNISSAAVAERVGMRREAHHLEDEWFKGEWSSSYLYAMLRSDWESRDNG